MGAKRLECIRLREESERGVADADEFTYEIQRLLEEALT